MSRRVVISSVTGRPIPWDEEPDGRDGASGAAAAARPDERPVIPDRLSEDAPEPGEAADHDARILRDVPPHWGTGA